MTIALELISHTSLEQTILETLFILRHVCLRIFYCRTNSLLYLCANWWKIPIEHVSVFSTVVLSWPPGMSMSQVETVFDHHQEPWTISIIFTILLVRVEFNMIVGGTARNATTYNLRIPKKLWCSKSYAEDGSFKTAMIRIHF